MKVYNVQDLKIDSGVPQYIRGQLIADALVAKGASVDWSDLTLQTFNTAATEETARGFLTHISPPLTPAAQNVRWEHWNDSGPGQPLTTDALVSGATATAGSDSPSLVADMRTVLDGLAAADMDASWNKFGAIDSQVQSLPSWSRYQASPGNVGQWRSNFRSALENPNLSAQDARALAADLSAMTTWWDSLPGNPRPVFVNPGMAFAGDAPVVKDIVQATLDTIRHNECSKGDTAHCYTDLGAADPPTNMGITLVTLQESRPEATVDDLKALTWDEASEIYVSKYISGPRIDQLPIEIAVQVADIGVNMGVTWGPRLLQRALNRLGTDPKLMEDGQVGPATISAAQAAVAPDSGITLNNALADVRRERYQYIVDHHPAKQQFLSEWLARADSFVVGPVPTTDVPADAVVTADPTPVSTGSTGATPMTTAAVPGYTDDAILKYARQLDARVAQIDNALSGTVLPLQASGAWISAKRGWQAARGNLTDLAVVMWTKRVEDAVTLLKQGGLSSAGIGVEINLPDDTVKKIHDVLGDVSGVVGSLATVAKWGAITAAGIFVASRFWPETRTEHIKVEGATR